MILPTGENVTVNGVVWTIDEEHHTPSNIQLDEETTTGPEKEEDSPLDIDDLQMEGVDLLADDGILQALIMMWGERRR